MKNGDYYTYKEANKPNAHHFARNITNEIKSVKLKKSKRIELKTEKETLFIEKQKSSIIWLDDFSNSSNSIKTNYNKFQQHFWTKNFKYTDNSEAFINICKKQSRKQKILLNYPMVKQINKEWGEFFFSFEMNYKWYKQIIAIFQYIVVKYFRNFKRAQNWRGKKEWKIGCKKTKKRCLLNGLTKFTEAKEAVYNYLKWNPFKPKI
ncbi:unnamed protein product [Blepharisma stoltei]|uniref:Group II intron maturase-specific domain-containing protein n=1 Tax=Blepharisma stoltei TaxID=1481888 RepID=A0AAU9IFU6_9CILI|nr:unnamed protein product [Blepharisma stoltei]